jgi:lipopolysaccharide transport system ATP-binding protein
VNAIIYHPAVAQYDNVAECLTFGILNNIEAFSHLETFDIGKVYIPQIWR